MHAEPEKVLSLYFPAYAIIRLGLFQIANIRSEPNVTINLKKVV